MCINQAFSQSGNKLFCRRLTFYFESILTFFSLKCWHGLTEDSCKIHKLKLITCGKFAGLSYCILTCFCVWVCLCSGVCVGLCEKERENMLLTLNQVWCDSAATCWETMKHALNMCTCVHMYEINLHVHLFFQFKFFQ